MLWTALLIPVGLCAALLALVFFFQPRFVYFPTRAIVMTPADIGLPYETVRFQAADGVELSGWFVPAEGSRGVVLFCHGNAGNISHRLDTLEILHRLGFSTLIFDYRGYGQSEGKPTEQGTYLDAEAAHRYLVQQRAVDPGEIIFFGRSLGGAIVAWLAQEHTPQALIMESTFTSVPDLAAHLYPYLPVRYLSRFRYNTVDNLSRVSCPVLIVHSRDDEMIPFSHGRRLFEGASEPKKFLEIRGSHNEGFMISADWYEEGLASFLRAGI